MQFRITLSLNYIRFQKVKQTMAVVAIYAKGKYLNGQKKAYQLWLHFYSLVYFNLMS